LRAGQARRAHRRRGVLIAAQLTRTRTPGTEADRPLRVAIAGLGPKGLFALERLLDHARGLDAAMRMQIDVFDPHPVPGAGPNYDPSQPAFLRMNFAADQIDMWWPGSRAVPVSEREAFPVWRARQDDADTGDYPPRAQVGRYLADGFDALRRHAPPNVDLRLWPTTVVAAEPLSGGWLVHTTGASRRCDELLVAVGHQGGSSVFPVDRRLSREAVPPRSIVAIRGFALTFIDAALALTEGRGGSFETLDHPYRLRYLPGTDDVRAILPFSRSGRPLLAKPGRAIDARFHGLGRIAAEGRARIALTGGRVDLHSDLVPILAATTCANLAAVGGGRADRSLRVAVGRWLAEAEGGVGTADELPAAEAIELSLAVAAGSARPGVSWALGHTWRTLSPAIVSRLGGDGLAERDWPAFLRLSAEMERVAFGPPAINAAKLLALVEAGRVDLGHVRGARLEHEHGRTALRSARGAQAVDVVIDAVLPGPGALGHPGLLAQLVADGHARIPSGRRGLEIAANGSCRGSVGAITPGLAALGRPTEDSVIGNDTLARGQHPQADRWARRVVQRCREEYVQSARRSLRERAPA
jgi:diaminopimelate decarboxylase